jgi:predicted acylesterase/phospholipase RssA
MFGAWQAGVWKSLSRRFRPDLVVGASVGSLNGWGVAGGIEPDRLAGYWLDRDVADLIRPRFGASLFDPAPLRATAKMLVETSRPVIPYATTMVEVPRLRLRIVRGEEVRWEHLVAACSFPTGFPPVRIDGHRYVDGGLLGALPVWAAAELGADRAIAIDALPSMPSALITAAVRAARLVGKPRAAPPDFPVQIIRPGATLGKLRDALYWNPVNAAKWIAQGERDGELSITM